MILEKYVKPVVIFLAVQSFVTWVFIGVFALQLVSVSINLNKSVLGPDAILPGATRKIERLDERVKELEAEAEYSN